MLMQIDVALFIRHESLAAPGPSQWGPLWFHLEHSRSKSTTAVRILAMPTWSTFVSARDAFLFVVLLLLLITFP